MNRKGTNSTPALPIPGLDKCIRLLRAGKVGAFETAARDLARRYPQQSKPIQLVGVAALMQGRLQEAVDSLQAAARLNQNDPTIWDNLGVALQRSGHPLEATECFQGSVRLDPTVAGVWVNAAANFGEVGDYVLARNCAAQAVKLAPALVEAHLNLGNALRLLGDNVTAIKALLRATELDPDCAEAHMGLSRVLESQDVFDLALKHARRALEIAPDYLDGKLAYALLCNYAAQAVDVLRQLRVAQPNDLVLAQGFLWQLLMDERETPETLFAAHRDFGLRFEPLFAALRKPHLNTREPGRKLRVGFISGDLRRHPVADHVLPLWSGLDRNKVSVHAYYTVRDSGNDATTAQLRSLADDWVDAADLSDDELAQRIRDDAIDILVDLAGHTGHNRIAVMLRKPAPVQMHWIGYPNTTGLTAIDYYIADAVFAPPAMDAFCTERLLRLPTYNNQQGMPDAPDVGPVPALTNGYVTFGSTARGNKINPRVVALWAQVLRAMPSARMLILDVGVEDVRRRIADDFVANGVGSARLAFRGRDDEGAFLAAHNEIDLILDTFPFNGGTTVTHAMYMGVPTVTLAGPFMAQRMAAARLVAMGMGDWVSGDEQGFVDTALRKAADLADLATLRATLRARLDAAPLRQPTAFAAAFEAGLREAWGRWCAGERPAAIDISQPVARARRGAGKGKVRPV